MHAHEVADADRIVDLAQGVRRPSRPRARPRPTGDATADRVRGSWWATMAGSADRRDHPKINMWTTTPYVENAGGCQSIATSVAFSKIFGLSLVRMPRAFSTV